MNTIYHTLVRLLQSGAQIQTGSLLSTKGSSPQVPGAMAIFEKEKVLHGTLGGGLLEAEAQKLAASLSDNPINTLQWVHFNADMKDKTGAICGGSSLFFIDANPEKHIEPYSQLVNSIDQKKSGVLLTFISKKGGIEINRIWYDNKVASKEKITRYLKEKEINIDRIISTRKPLWIESIEGLSGEQTSLFIEPIFPVSQLVIVGAGHIGQALSKISASVDFDIVVLDNRAEMAVSERFPEASQIICKPINESLNKISITSETYIVIATQGHRTDIEALKCCIGSSASYIGVIGSKRKTALMEKEFIDKKWATQEEWNRIHAPIGIDIHSKSVNEIAVSILAELIKERFETNFLNGKKRVDSVVLAAGKSTRMGQQKLLMPYKNSSIIKTIVLELEASLANQTIVVTGSNKEEVQEALKGCDLNFVFNDSFELGMLSSVQKGIESISHNTDGILVLLGDQPMVSRKVIDRLIIEFQKVNKGLVVPTFKGKRGHPVLISSKYKNQIKLINPEVGLRELFLNNQYDILEVEINTEDILKDIDTPEDYRNETRTVD